MSLLENLSPLVFPSKPVRSYHTLSWLRLTHTPHTGSLAQKLPHTVLAPSYAHTHTGSLAPLQFFQSSKASTSQSTFRTSSSPFESNFTQPICLENANKFFGDQLKVQINSKFCNLLLKLKKKENKSSEAKGEFHHRSSTFS